ncbi:MAG: PAS domain S-box protein [Chloroflexi bacterium]|nr:PAS domain S-box protein [Chloroflexota bacterium]
MRTVIFSYIISNAICTMVVLSLYLQNRKRFKGLGFWLADFVMQFIVMVLVILRDSVPDFVSMTVSNALVVGGTMFLLVGLEWFWGKRRPQLHNLILLEVFIIVHAYFVFVYPSLKVRNIIFSLGLLAVCAQCAWLMLQRVDVEIRHHTRTAGTLFVAYCLVSVARILIDLAIPAGNDFFRSNVYDTSVVMLYQMLFIGLTFSLLLMVNHRLVIDLEQDVAVREQTESALRLSDEKFQKAFHSSPDAVLITRMNDGKIVEVNEGFSQITGYSREESLGNTTIDLGLWADPKVREGFVSALQGQSRLRGVEYDFRSRSGKILKGLLSAEVVLLGDTPHLLAIIHDITQRKQMEEALRERNALLETLRQATLDMLARRNMDDLLSTLVESARKLLDAHAVSIDLLEGTDMLITYAASSDKFLKVGDTVWRGKEGFLSWQAVDSGEPAIMEDYATWEKRRALYEGLPLHAAMVVPIKHKDSVVGTINFARSNSNQPFTETDIYVAGQFAQMTALVMDNAQVYSQLQSELKERIQVEEALRQSRERYQAFISQSFEAIYRTEFDHPIDISLPVETQIDLIYENAYMAECNQTLAGMYGLSSAEAMVGMRLVDAHGGRDNPVNRAAFRKFIEGDYRSINDETMEYDKAGNPVWFLSNTIGIVENGRLVRMWGTSIDITRRKKMELDLRNSEQRYQLIFDTMERGVIYQAADGYVTSVNSAAEKILGLTLEQMQEGMLIEPYWSAIREDGSLFSDESHPFMAALQTGRPVSNVVMRVFNPKLNEYRWISINAMPQFKNGEDVPYQVYTTFDDVTEHKLADEVFQVRLKLFELSSSLSLGELMQVALDQIGPILNSPIGFYHFVESDQKTLSLQAWSTRTLSEFCKAEGRGLHYPIDQAGVWTDCVFQRKPVIHNDYPSLPNRHGLPPGHAEVIRELVVPILRNGLVVSILGVGNKPSNYTDKDAQLVSYLADVIWEIVERKRTEEKLQQLSRAVEQSPASIVITDTKGCIEYVNPRFTEVTGYSAEEVIGRNPRILKTALTPKETHRELWETVTAGRDWQGEFVNRRKSGAFYYELASISPILDVHGSITHYVAVKEDVTESKESQLQLRSMNEQLAEQIRENLKLQEILREQAIRDPLTGLYNRRYLYETMGRELARARREKYPISFMMMDIDRFKQVNDTYGHDAGDMVLVALADLLHTHTRQGDIACRYGGEEFLVIMLRVGETDAKRRAEEIRNSFNDLHMDYDNTKLSASISIGVAFYPRDGSDSDAVIKAADTAMYQAKHAGRNCVRVWEVNSQPT